MTLRFALVLTLALLASAQPPGPVDLPLKVNAGGPTLPAIGYTEDSLTNPAQFFSSNSFKFTSSAPVTVPPGADNEAIYQTERVGVGNLTFSVVVPFGKTFSVSTKHAESYMTAPGQRKFSIVINGELKESDIDIFERVGRNVALDLTFNNIKPRPDPVTETIKIIFVGVVQNPVVNGIEIKEAPSMPAVSGRKINVGGPAVEDYEADDVGLITGNTGFVYTSSAPVSVPTDGNMEVYKTERVAVGPLTYAIPAADGMYTVKTKHAESFFNAAGQRKFSAEINGEVKEADIDIFERVGKDVALVLAFPGISPVNGKITVRFIPGVEMPIVNAIEIMSGGTTVTPTPTPDVVTPTPTPPAECPAGTTEAPVLMMNVGGPQFGEYVADDVSLITGPAGFVYPSPGEVMVAPGATNAQLYKTERYTTGQSMVYNIPVTAAGDYLVKTYFSEGFHNEAGQRVFNVEINGVVTNKNVDVFAASGGKDKTLILSSSVTMAADGSIVIKFLRVTSNPMVNGISISRCGGDSQPTTLPTCESGNTGVVQKLNAGGPSLNDIGYVGDDVSLIDGPQGSTWTSPGAIMADAGVENKEVFKTERFTFGASLAYKIPVMEAGVYTVQTFFSEGFQSAAGERVLSLEINGEVTNADVDVFAASGGKDKMLVLTNKVTMTAAGDIIVKVLRVTSNPLINGINIAGCSCEGAACPTGTPAVSPSPPPPAVDVKMNIGGPAIPALGYAADNDQLIVGPAGLTYESSADVAVPVGDDNMQVYKTERFAEGATLTYKFPVVPGTYTVETLHAESFFTKAGQRKFGIKINGVTKETGIDLAGTDGQNVAVVKKFEGIEVAEPENSITIELTNEVENPLINGIHIMAAEPTISPGTPTPAPIPTPAGDVLKLNVGDVNGGIDDYVSDIPNYVKSTSSIATNTNNITLTGGATSRFVYRSERFTLGPSLDFEIPVAAGGSYTVTTELAETFFNGPNIRKFDIEINGAVVKPSLDVFEESGAMNTALVLSFPNITTVTRNGSTVIEMKLKKIMREPMINGITVTSS